MSGASPVDPTASTANIPPFEGTAAVVAERIALHPSLSTQEKAEFLDILGITRKVYREGKKTPTYRRLKEWRLIWQSTQEENEPAGPISPTQESQSRMVS